MKSGDKVYFRYRYNNDVPGIFRNRIISDVILEIKPASGSCCDVDIKFKNRSGRFYYLDEFIPKEITETKLWKAIYG